ncbi:MAG: hypothetical protein U0359_01690 [Byssovorax sp.]
MDDWVGYHIRGMILLRKGDLRAAEKVLDHGVQSCPFPAQRDYFRTALAAVRLRRHNLDGVLSLLQQVTLPALLVPANVLYTHTLDMQNKRDLAAKAFARIPANDAPLLNDIREELRRRIQGKPQRYDDDKLISLEIDLLVQAA